jgi:hypothetical protein
MGHGFWEDPGDESIPIQAGEAYRFQGDFTPP